MSGTDGPRHDDEVTWAIYECYCGFDPSGSAAFVSSVARTTFIKNQKSKRGEGITVAWLIAGGFQATRNPFVSILIQTQVLLG